MMDFVTDLPLSKGYDSILAVVDRLTKMVHYIPCRKTLTAAGLADFFIRDIMRMHGIPESIISDRGTLFTSQFWSSLCFILRVRHRLSTAFHPQTDGQTERQNQTMEQYLWAYINYQQDDWVKWLPLTEFAYNNTIHATLSIIPFYAIYGYNPSSGTELKSLEQTPQTELDVPVAKERAQFIKELQEYLAERITESQYFQARYYNNKHTQIEFRVGDRVWLLSRNICTLRSC